MKTIGRTIRCQRMMSTALCGRRARLVQRAARHQKEIRASFDARLEFEIKLIPYDGDDAWVEGALAAIRDTLRGSGPKVQGRDQGSKPMLRFGQALRDSSSAISRLMASNTAANCSS